MKLFDTLYGSDEASSKDRKALTEKRVARGYDSAIDSLDGEILDLTARRDALRHSIANGAVDDISKLWSVIDDIECAENAKKIIEAERAIMLG